MTDPRVGVSTGLTVTGPGKPGEDLFATIIQHR